MFDEAWVERGELEPFIEAVVRPLAELDRPHAEAGDVGGIG